MQEALLPRVQSAFQRAFDLEPRSITLATQPDDIPMWDSLGHATQVCSLGRAHDQIRHRRADGARKRPRDHQGGGPQARRAA